MVRLRLMVALVVLITARSAMAQETTQPVSIALGELPSRQNNLPSEGTSGGSSTQDEERWRPRLALLIPGSALFVVTYLPLVVGGLANGNGTICIPIVGPILNARGADGLTGFYDAAFAFGQTSGLALIAMSLIWPERWLVSGDGTVAVVPMMNTHSYGLSVAGKF